MHCISLKHLFPSYVLSIGIIRPTANYPHEDKHIWTSLRMNASFTGTKDGTSAHTYGTSKLTPAASFQPQGPISNASLYLPLRHNSNINNCISTYATRHHIPFLKMTRMSKSQSNSAIRRRKSMIITSKT